MKLLPDVGFTCGLASVAWGCHLAWPPLAYIVPGLIVMGIVLFVPRETETKEC